MLHYFRIWLASARYSITRTMMFRDWHEVDFVREKIRPELESRLRAKGFEVLPRRWVVERTFAWLGRCRRLAKDWEKSIASSTAWALIASIRMLTRRTARYCWN